MRYRNLIEAQIKDPNLVERWTFAMNALSPILTRAQKEGYTFCVNNTLARGKKFIVSARKLLSDIVLKRIKEGFLCIYFYRDLVMYSRTQCLGEIEVNITHNTRIFYSHLTVM